VFAADGEEDPKEALIKSLTKASTDEEFNSLVDESTMLIDSQFWLKINSLSKQAPNSHETDRLSTVAQKVWIRLEELNKGAEDDSGNGLDEYYAVLGSPDEEIQELTAEQIMEKRTKRWLDQQLSEMWRNYRTFEKHHIGTWHGQWETYDDILGGERMVGPSHTANLVSTMAGYAEDVEGIKVCKHKQTVEAVEGEIMYPSSLLDKGLGFWPNSPKTWLVANVFSTGNRVQEGDQDIITMETAIRCDSVRMRVLANYEKLDPKNAEDETFVLGSISVGREKLEEMPSGEENALFASNSILEDSPGLLLNTASGSNVTLATRGNLILQTPRMIRPGSEHFMQVSWKTPPTESLSEELKEVYGEDYSKQAANLGLIITTKRVFSRMDGAAEYISLKEELPEDWKQEY